MKFRKIAFKNHPILGNLQLDFTDANGDTVDTIILAGENGCGKTSILDALFHFFERNVGKEILAEIELNENEIAEIKKKFITPIAKELNNKSEILTIEFNHNFHSPELYKNKRSIASSLQRMNHDYDRLFGKIYSDVEINFSPNQITSITAKDIDQRINKTIKSNTNIATEITQLLIDVKALDDAELADWVNEHTGQIPPDSVKNSRIKRFTNAFHSIFETKRFKGVENKANRKVVNFEEKGRIMSIDQLSSGEKQIVFRGGFLLKDKKSNEGAYVLVDEPEISLHPKWQLEILPFLKKLFTNENGTQTSQIIIATHSPFIIHNTNRKNDKVIVLQKNAMGRIEVASNPEFYAWRPKEIVKEAFNIDFEMGQYEKVVFVEGETDEKYYNKALEVYGYEKNKIHIEWIGRNVEKGKSENTGDKALNSALTFFLANKFILKSPTVLLYDCDTHKPKVDDAPLYVRTMTYNTNNEKYKKGVENLLALPKSFDYDQFYSINEKTDDYGAVSIHKSLNKTKLCDHICNYSNEELKSVLENLRLEIDKINAIKL